jgi:ribonuclease D
MIQPEVASPELVQTQEGLNELAARLSREPRIAVDTESNSLHAYREQVCLMQFSTAAQDYVVDVLALDDTSALGPIFESSGIEKIFHAAEYDILCMRRDYGFGFSSIFDTMQAGRILGRKMAGLDRLIEEKFGVKVNKRLQKANWGARPLSRELLQYAAQDTHYLIPLRDMLEGELREKGLIELAEEDFRMACANHVHQEKDPAESPAWLRLSARRDLTSQELTILKALLEWREAVSAQLDRPPFKVLTDEQLITIARARPSGADQLAGIITDRQARQWGNDLLQAVSRGLGSPLVQRRRPATPTSAYLKRLERLKEWRKKAAASMDVESDVVLPRSLLLALADKGPQELETIMKPSPWRLSRFGDQIAAVLQSTPS